MRTWTGFYLQGLRQNPLAKPEEEGEAEAGAARRAPGTHPTETRAALSDESCPPASSRARLREHSGTVFPTKPHEVLSTRWQNKDRPSGIPKSLWRVRVERVFAVIADFQQQRSGTAQAAPWHAQPLPQPHRSSRNRKKDRDQEVTNGLPSPSPGATKRVARAASGAMAPREPCTSPSTWACSIQHKNDGPAAAESTQGRRVSCWAAREEVLVMLGCSDSTCWFHVTR